jgi:hypothetical protein
MNAVNDGRGGSQALIFGCADKRLLQIAAQDGLKTHFPE